MIKVKYHLTTSTLTWPTAPQEQFFAPPPIQNQLYIYSDILISTLNNQCHLLLCKLVLFSVIVVRLWLFSGIILFSVKKTVSLCKLVLFSVKIFRSMKKILSLDVFEWAKWQVVLHHKPEVSGSTNLKIRNRSGSNKKRSAADLPVNKYTLILITKTKSRQKKLFTQNWGVFLPKFRWRPKKKIEVKITRSSQYILLIFSPNYLGEQSQMQIRICIF